MSTMDSKLQKSLGHELSQQGLELVDFVAVPKHGDRMVRFRTVQEVLNDFDALSEDESTQTYIVHVRKRETAAEKIAPSPALDARTAISADGIYLSNGRLNSAYLIDNAKLLFSAGEYASARQIYETLKRSGDQTATALYGMARCLEAEGRTDEAMKNFEESILYSPTLEAYQRFAALLIKTKKDQQASEVLERALNLKELAAKTRFELHKAVGNCSMRAGLNAKAERHYRSALDLQPASDVIAANLGMLYIQNGKIVQAENAFADAIRVNSKNDLALNGLATLRLSQGRVQEAHNAFAAALRVKMDNPKAIFHLVKCAYKIKSFDTACELLTEYIQVAPFNANLLYSLAGLQYHLGRKGEARRTVDQIISIQPNHTEAKNLGALIDQA